MKFWLSGAAWRHGSEKAIYVTDRYDRGYWIPRKCITIIEEQTNDTGNVNYIVNIADWVLHKNNVPIFDTNEMQLIR